MDATVFPLLKELDRGEDPHNVLHATHGLQYRIVNNQPTKNTLRLCLKTTRICISKARRADFGNNRGQYNTEFAVNDGYLYIRLGAMKKYAKTKV